MSMSFKASPDGTYGEILVNGQVVAKLPVTGNAVIPNLVGTVSQSGGVPTGAVVERGSNANGGYVRFADGTQICWQVHSNPSWTGSNNTSATWTYPAAFSAIPVVNPTILTGLPNQFNASVSGQTATSAPIFTGGTTSSGGPATTYVTAIGRWY